MDIEDAVRRFDADGFIGPLDILNTADAMTALTEFDAWFKDEQKPANRFKTHLVLPTASKIVHHPKIIEIARKLLRTSNVLCWSTDWNTKPPGSPYFFAPHQDSTYAGLEPAGSVLTVWVAISDPVTAHEGCLSFWKESHKVGQIPHQQESSEFNLLSLGQHCPAPAGNAIAVPLCAGQATIHHFRTVHASGPNRSVDQTRVGFAIRYMAANVRQRGHIQESVTLVSGSLEHDGFILEPILPCNPTEDDIEIGRAAQEDAMRRESGNYFSAQPNHRERAK